MKTLALGLSAVAVAVLPTLFAQPAPAEAREVRVLHARPALPGTEEPGKPLTYLGVSVSKNAELAAHLGLIAGMGLVVNAVTPDSPAAAILKPHDVLTKFEDQWLVNGEQLAVLVRSRKEGDEVALTYVRAGQTSTTKVKLGTHTPAPPSFGFSTPALRWEHAVEGVPAVPGAHFEVRRLPGSFPKGEVDRTLSIAGGVAAGAGDVVFHAARAPVARLMGMGEGNLLFSDDQGSLEIKNVGGRRELVAKDAEGTVLFNGPITTEEERKALPENVRTRLQQFEGINTLRFRTGEQFQPGDVRMITPGAVPQSIGFPHGIEKAGGRAVL